MAVVELTQAEDSLRDYTALAMQTDMISAVFISSENVALWTIDGESRLLRVTPGSADSVYRKIRDAM